MLNTKMKPDYNPLPQMSGVSEHMDTKPSKLSSCQHIPDQIKKCISRETHTEGWKTGLNDVILREQEFFKAYMIMAGMIFNSADDMYVPHVPGQDTPRTQIGMGWAINVSDLNIFFGRITGAYGIPEKSK